MDPIPLAALAESKADEEDIANGKLPWGYHDEVVLEQRDPSVVETDFEIELYWREALTAGVRRPSVACGYCAERIQIESLDSAIRWWNAHDCMTLSDREFLGALWDQGINLPEGHPFSPSVDGRQAA